MTTSKKLARTGLVLIGAGLVISLALEAFGSRAAGQAGNVLFLLLMVVGVGLLAAAVLSGVARRVLPRRRRRRS